MHSLPVINTALGALGAVKGIFGSNAASKRSDKALAASGKLAGIEAKNAEANLPILDQLRTLYPQLTGPLAEQALAEYKTSREYDPRTETNTLMGEYDKTARETLDSELGKVNTESANRGFTPGTSSIDNGRRFDALASRALARGKYRTDLLASEGDRKLARTNNSRQGLLSALATLNPIQQSSAVGGQLSSAGGAYARNAETYGARSNVDISPSLDLINKNFKKIWKP